MNENLLQLETLFNKMVDMKDPEKFSVLLVEYLTFVEQTPPFNRFIKEEIRPFHIVTLYKELDKEREKYGSNPKVPSYAFYDIKTVRPFVRTFHMNLVGQAEKTGLTSKKSVSIHTSPKSQRVCLMGNEPLCYPFKGSDTDRYEVVHMLYGTESGKTVSDILEKLGKSDASNVKRAIKEINKEFKENTQTTHNLIESTKNKNKNVYFLNRKHFIFTKQK